MLGTCVAGRVSLAVSALVSACLIVADGKTSCMEGIQVRMHHGHSCTAEGRAGSRTNSGAAVSRSGGVLSPHIGFLPVTRGADPCDGVPAAADTTQGDQRRWHNAGAAAVACVDGTDAGGSRSRMLLPGPLGRVATAELLALIGSLPGGVSGTSDGACYRAHSATTHPGHTAQPRGAMPHSHQFPSSLGCAVAAGAVGDQELPASPCGKRCVSFELLLGRTCVWLVRR